MILISKNLLPKGYNGLAIYPFMILKSKALKQNRVVLNHERIHFRQQIELLLIPFYIWYVTEFIIYLIKYKNWHMAYYNISFEREAYNNETDFNYLKKRKFWQFLNYMSK
jgi:hypothetical protein